MTIAGDCRTPGLACSSSEVEVSDALNIGIAISQFAEAARRKLSAIGAKGEPEDQIRAPLEGCGVPLR